VLRRDLHDRSHLCRGHVRLRPASWCAACLCLVTACATDPSALDGGLDSRAAPTDAGPFDAGPSDAGPGDAGRGCADSPLPSLRTEPLLAGATWTRPVALTQPTSGDDAIFVAEKSGLVYRVSSGERTVFLDIRVR